MRVLYVDQFGKTAGRDSVAQCEFIKEKYNEDITLYLSDNTELQKNKKISVDIKWGFHDAYNGNAVNKVIHYIKALHDLKKYVKNNRFDIIHLQWFSLPWLEWMYVKSLRKYGKIVITIHDVIPFNNRPFEMKALDEIYKQSDCLLLHTESSKKVFLENYRSRKPMYVITQGFCLKSDYAILNKQEAKRHFGIPDDAIVFLYYGTIRKSKGLNYLIEAIGKARENNHNIVLLAGGAFQKEDPEVYNELIKSNLDEDSFYGKLEFISMDEEPYFFSAADVLCLPYLEITQSGVAQVGLMYDLPMIASKIGEMGEVTKQDYNGELVEPGSVNELERSILKLANSPDLRSKYSNASHEMGIKEFSLEIKAKKVYEAYCRVLSKEDKK